LVASRDILRGVKIAAYVFAGLLVWMVVRNVMTPAQVAAPAAPVADSEPATMPLPSPPLGHHASPAVPPPPPLPGHARVGSPGRPGARQPVETHGAPQIREIETGESSGPTLAGLSSPSGTATPVPETAEVKSSDQSPGIVIVVPPVRATQESRGKRWVKAVGRALHIGQ
jgi:hypothetical protein